MTEQKLMLFIEIAGILWLILNGILEGIEDEKMLEGRKKKK